MKLKDIKGYEGLYAITEDGRVWSYLSNKWLKLVIIRGYYCVILYKDGKSKTFLIHRLVYSIFKGEIPKGLVVDHIDSNRLNNTLDNLQLLTRGDNTRKAWLGKNHNEATKRKMSEAHKGKSPGNKGKKHTDEARRKMSEVRKGKKHTEEARRKIGESVRRTKALRKLNA